MTASKIWALIVALILVGGGLIGGVVYYQQHPDLPQVTRLMESLPGKPSSSSPAAPKPSTPSDTAKMTSAKPESAPAPKAETATAPPKPEIAKEEPAPPKPEPSAGDGEPPHFDVVRVEPSGDAVVAGKGDPDSKVALVASGKVVAEAKTDSNGQFVILPPPLKPGDHDLTLRETPDGKPAVESKQNVAVSIPKKAGDQVVVALAEPGKPTKLLTPSPEAKAATAPPPSATTPPHEQVAVAKPDTKAVPPADEIGLAIRSAELENGDGFFASGVARSGTHVEVYLNGSHLAQVMSGADKQWTVTVKRGLAGGHYTVRADAIEGRSVVARVEVPFDVPTAMAESAAPKQPEPPAAKIAKPPAPAQATVATAEPAPAAQSKEPSPIPVPRPDIAARAKAAVAAAPDIAPPTLAAAPPAPPNPATAPKPSQTPIAPATSSDSAPTLARAKPTLAPPKPAVVAAAPAVPESATVPTPSASPATVAAAKPAEPTDTSMQSRLTSGPPSANAVIDQVETALVSRGDNLWDISRVRLGNGMRYTQIYAANVSQIRNPNLIYPGQVFVMPQP